MATAATPASADATSRWAIHVCIQRPGVGYLVPYRRFFREWKQFVAGGVGGSPEYIDYHDQEWGRPEVDRDRLFEKLCLEGFQSGLSWITILRKRDNFRAAFADFVPEAVAEFGSAEVDGLLADPGIVRHKGKIESTINNARRLIELETEVGDFPAWVWRGWFDPSDEAAGEVLATTPASVDLAKQLKKAGFSFVGPTTVYAFMQAMGLVNDHEADCFVRATCQRERMAAARRIASG